MIKTEKCFAKVFSIFFLRFSIYVIKQVSKKYKNFLEIDQNLLSKNGLIPRGKIFSLDGS